MVLPRLEVCAACGGRMGSVWDGKSIRLPPSYYQCTDCRAIQYCLDWGGHEPEEDARNEPREQGSTESAEGWVERKQATALRSAQRLPLRCDSREYPGGVQGKSLGNKQF